MKSTWGSSIQRIAFAASILLAACGDSEDGTSDTSEPDVPAGPAELQLDATSRDFGSVLVGDSSARATCIVTNIGGSPSGAIALTLGGDDRASFTVAGNTCRGGLAPMGSCTITVLFMPRAAGAQSATLGVAADKGNIVSVALEGEGTAPGALSIASDIGDLGSVTVGATSATRATFTVTNGGGADTGPLTVQATGAHPSDFTRSDDACQDEVLAPGATCTFVVTFTPRTSGPKSASFQVSAYPGGRVSGAVSGIGASPARLVALPVSQPFGSVVVGADSAPLTIRVANAGGSASGPIAVTAAGDDGAMFSASGACVGETLAPGAACDLAVVFTPTSLGPKRGQIEIGASPGGTAVTTVTGSGIGPQLVIAPTLTAFAPLALDAVSAPRAFTVTNRGDRDSGPITTTLAGIDPGEFQIGDDTCDGVALPPNGRCTLVVLYTPGTAGPASAELVVASVQSGTATAGLSGAGLPPAALVIAPEDKGFGAIAVGRDTAAQSFTLTNGGGERSGLLTIALGGADADQFRIVAESCPARLGPGKTCEVRVRFRPSAIGEAAAALTVSGDPGGTATAALSGEGVDPDQLVVTPPTFTFPPTAVGASASQTFTVDNDSAAATGTLVVDTTGPHARDFTFTRDCTALAPHATCTVTVTFTPSAPGLRSAALNVGGNPGGRVSSALAGVAVPGLEIVDAAGMAAATRFDFGDVIVATTLDHEADVIVRNNTTADATLTLSTRFGEPAQYTLVSNTCDATDIIAAGATCTVRVRFRPTSLGLKSGKVTFAIGSGPYDRAIWDLVGRGVDALRIVPETTSQFGEVPRNTRSAPLTFRVDNPLGAQPSGPLAASLGGAGYRIEDDGCAGLTLAAGASCTITVTFAPLGNGFSPGTLRVTGNPGGTATQALAATAVDPVGARPSAVALTPASVAENLPIGTVVGTLTTTDADAGDTFAYTLVNGSGSSGNARFELTGNTIATRVVFDHEATPTQTIRVRVVDSGGQVFDQVLTIVVANVDEPAVTTPDAATVREDAAATLVDVLVNDLDPDGDVLLASASQPGHGAVVVAAGKTSLTYRPAADYCNTPPGSALDTFTYTLEGSGAVGTVQVAVTCVDDPGVAVDDEAEVTQGDDATEIDVLANDRDIDSALLIDSVSQPSEGEVEIVDGGAALTYEPAPNPTETEIEFSYELVGGGTAIVRVEVTILDDAPTTDDDTATVAEDAAATAIDVLANDDDTDGGPMLIRSVVQPANGTVVLTGPSNARTGLTYAPDPDYCNDPPGTALDTFTYTLNGGAVGTVTVTVTCSDDAPTADDDTATLAEDASATAIDVLGNDDDVDGGTITIAAIGSAPSHGTVVLTGGSLGAHTGLTYEPADDYCNTPPGTALDTFTYQINGGAVGTVTVAVTCADDAPTADDDTATVAEDAAATAIDVLANDDDVDGGTKVIASIVQAPTHGAVVLTGGTAGAHTGLTYEPNDNYCNTPPGTALDTFTYALNGGDTATVAVTVTCVDDPPVAGPTDTASVAEDAAATAIDVLANDGDGGDGGAKVIASISQAPQNGNVVLTGGSAGAHTGLTYEPNDDYCNTPPGTALDTFKYLLNGGSEGTVAVTVNCVDDPPVAVTDVATVLEDAAAASAIDVLANDTDVDGGPKTIASNGAATLGTVTLTGGTSGAHTGLTYKASADACGADTFTYTLNGGSSATVGVTVTCVNDAPSFTAGPDVTRANSTSGGLAITHTVDPWAADIAAGPGNELGQALDFIVSNDNNGLFTIQPAVSSTGVLTFTTNPAVEGSALVTIALHDNGGTANEGDDTSASQTFTITTVNQTAPIITSADNTAFKVGTEGIFIVTADGVPGGGDITLSSSGTLPSGVIFVDNDDGTATLIGTPAAGTAGTYALTITADNGIDPDATQSFTLTVNQSPAITSADSDTFLVLVADAFTVTTTGFPTNASMAITTNSALPSGVTLTNNNDGTATLGGTPAAGSGGSYAITIIADNGVSPPASQGFTLIVNQPPAITSPNTTTFITQTAGSFEVTTTGFPTNASMTISRSGALPSGVTFTNNGNGKATLVGTPAAGTGGTYPITITANNGVSPEATQSFTLTVQQPRPSRAPTA